MAYHAQADVERILQMKFTNNTECAASDVADYISKTEIYVNSRLTNKYQTPITGTTALVAMNEICTLITAGKIAQAYGYGYRREADPGTKEQVPSLLAQGERRLTRLVTGEDTLVFRNDVTGSAVLVNSNGEKVTSSFQEENITGSQYSDFDIDKSRDVY